ncbi:hypothetical protein H9P43_002203 [Blastocladiella emersonii ATCC 22665]|nr:hypothetical protein H9P43_002203 [Blastocladiella emersonii ATCC 22665]
MPFSIGLARNRTSSSLPTGTSTGAATSSLSLGVRLARFFTPDGSRFRRSSTASSFLGGRSSSKSAAAAGATASWATHPAYRTAGVHGAALRHFARVALVGSPHALSECVGAIDREVARLEAVCRPRIALLEERAAATLAAITEHAQPRNCPPRTMYKLRKLLDAVDRDLGAEFQRAVTLAVPFTPIPAVNVAAGAATAATTPDMVATLTAPLPRELAAAAVVARLRKAGFKCSRRLRNKDARALHDAVVELITIASDIATHTAFVERIIYDLVPILRELQSLVPAGNADAMLRDRNALLERTHARLTALAGATPAVVAAMVRGLARVYPDPAEYTCPCCLEILADAVVLKCKHKLCRPCFQRYRDVNPAHAPGTVFLTFTNDDIRPLTYSAVPPIERDTLELMEMDIAPAALGASPGSVPASPTESTTSFASNAAASRPSTSSSIAVGRNGTYTMPYVSPFLGMGGPVSARPIMQRLPCPLCRVVSVVSANDARPCPGDPDWERTVASLFPREVKQKRAETKKEKRRMQVKSAFLPMAGGLRTPSAAVM